MAEPGESAGAEIESGPGTSHRLMRSILLRGLGVAYLSAFASLGVQLGGLIGSRGILPAADYLDGLRGMVGRVSPWLVWRVPTVFWLDASDRVLEVICWGGAGLGVLLILGILPGACLVLAWLFYLSLMVVGRDFLSFQWDILLLESGLLAMLLTPWTWRLDRAARRAGAVRRLAVPLAGVPPDAPLGAGEAHERRSDLVDMAGDRLSLFHPATADLDELVHAPASRVVP